MSEVAGTGTFMLGIVSGPSHVVDAPVSLSDGHTLAFPC